MRRTLLLFTMVGAMLLALSGVVLAQQSGPDRTTPDGGELRAAADNGFTGDPRTSPITGRYYGYLAHADGY